jgi:hypothetical protein
MLLLALAFGLVQAGLIDQSLFNPDYRAIPYWDEMREPTLIPAIGVSASTAFDFLKGHVFGSICAPIALAEALVPQRSTRPWLGPVGLAVMAMLWLLAAWFVLVDTLAQEAFTASLAQLAWTAALVVVLVVVAFRLPSTAGRGVESGPVPAPLVVGVLSLVLLGMRTVLDALSPLGLEPYSWQAAGIALGAVVVWLVVVGRWSRRRGWDGRHILAAAAGSLLGVAGTAFIVEPLGDVPAMAKYVTNAVLLAIVLLLVAWAARAQGGTRPSAPGEPRTRGQSIARNLVGVSVSGYDDWRSRPPSAVRAGAARRRFAAGGAARLPTGGYRYQRMISRALSRACCLIWSAITSRACEVDAPSSRCALSHASSLHAKISPSAVGGTDSENRPGHSSRWIWGYAAG